MPRPSPVLPSVLLAVLAACASTLPPPGAPPATTPAPIPSAPEPAASVLTPPDAGPRPPVVVAIVVDQLAAWVARERWHELPKTGGFARLRAEGTWVIEARHGHAATDTAPGHSMLFTGQPPTDTGIFANEVLDGKSRVSILKDSSTRMIGSRGPLDGAGSSLRRLRVDTIADRLKKKNPDALVIGVSLKDRGALFGCGRKPDGCLWFDTGLDGFVTSTAFSGTFPAWAIEAASPEATARVREKPWEPLNPTWLKAHASTPDDQPGEGDWYGFGKVFPHVFTNSTKPASSFRASPAGDERVLGVASAALHHEKFGRVPTLLTISLSSNDYVGHVFGPDSWEAWDHLARLDQALALFFQLLDAKLGANRYAVVLSADHGVTPMPETYDVATARGWCKLNTPDRWRRSCVKGGRLLMDPMAADLEAAAIKALGKGKWVAGIADPYVFLTPAGRELPPARRKKLHDALSEAAGKNACVERVIDARARPEVCPAIEDESIDGLLCRSMPRNAELEFYVLPKVGCFFDSDYVVGFGTSHGTPYPYDRAVPVLARAPGKIKAGALIDPPTTTEVYAATLAALLEIEPPPRSSGARPLTQTTGTPASGAPSASASSPPPAPSSSSPVPAEKKIEPPPILRPFSRL